MPERARAGFGLFVPNSSPHAAGVSIDEILDLARHADAHGFEAVWAGDHLVWPIPNLEVFSVLTAIAVVTTRVQIGPCVLLLGLRHPLLVAQAAQTLDIVARGRLVMGVGAGGERTEEFETLGVRMEERGSRTTEALEVLRQLWREPRTSYSGRHFTLSSVPLVPKPLRTPPIWVGGRSRGARERAARLGDGWVPAFMTPEMYREGWDDLAALAVAAGRDPARIQRAMLLFLSVAPSRAEARRDAVAHMEGFYRIPFDRFERFVVFGTADECRDRLEVLVEAGVEHFAVIPATPTPRAVMDVCIERFIPAFAPPTFSTREVLQ